MFSTNVRMPAIQNAIYPMLNGLIDSNFPNRITRNEMAEFSFVMQWNQTDLNMDNRIKIIAWSVIQTMRLSKFISLDSIRLIFPFCFFLNSRSNENTLLHFNIHFLNIVLTIFAPYQINYQMVSTFSLNFSCCDRLNAFRLSDEPLAIKSVSVI